MKILKLFTLKLSIQGDCKSLDTKKTWFSNLLYCPTAYHHFKYNIHVTKVNNDLGNFSTIGTENNAPQG